MWVSEPVTHDVEKKRVMIHRQTEIYLCGHRVTLFNLLSELGAQFNKIHLTHMFLKCISHSGSISKHGKNNKKILSECNINKMMDHVTYFLS